MLLSKYCCLYKNYKQKFLNFLFILTNITNHIKILLLLTKKNITVSFVILLKSSNIGGLHGLLSSFQANFKPHHSISLKIDVDPQNLS